ncbi:hypothetical protein C8R42DRAFT_728367 [Lentinula raphanica]|nr:hypothetical protein C8R42DRAFT_728367 [Lentinula raphanica]
MPKAPPPPKSPTKKSVIIDYTAHISARLRAIRASLSLPTTFPRPSVGPNEVIAGIRMYHGVTHNVDGPLHTRFDQLGRLFYVVCNKKSAAPSIRIIWEDVPVPRAALEADTELIRLLELRSAVQGNGGSSQSAAPSPSGCSTSAPTPSGSSTSRSFASRYSASRSSASRSSVSRSSNTGSSPLPPEPAERVSAAGPSTRQAISLRLTELMSAPAALGVDAPSTLPAQSDDEVEFVGFVHPNGDVLPQRPARRLADDEVEFVGFAHPNGDVLPERPARRLAGKLKDAVQGSTGGAGLAKDSGPTPPKSIMITIIAWAANSYEHTTVKLSVESGHLITLNSVTEALRTLQLSKISDLDRYIPGKGWARILMNTPFRVRDGDIVSLKPSALKVIQNFEIHAPHFSP